MWKHNDGIERVFFLWLCDMDMVEHTHTRSHIGEIINVELELEPHWKSANESLSYSTHIHIEYDVLTDLLCDCGIECSYIMTTDI